MYAVYVTVDIDPGVREQAQQELQSRVVPAVKQAPGAVAGYWFAPDDSGGGPSKGRSVILAESREAAEGLAEMAKNSPTPPGVTITAASVMEVVAHF